MKELSIEPMSAVENTLSMLGRKYVSNGELNAPETLMACTAAAEKLRSYYGPDLREIDLRGIELPESVKGLLTDYAS
ncbi:MAG: hypothetical protein IJU37_13180 [Desulfovibrio sp.]|nr:hypothetical protein [Desulfovibrio sp.]